MLQHLFILVICLIAIGTKEATAFITPARSNYCRAQTTSTFLNLQHNDRRTFLTNQIFAPVIASTIAGSIIAPQPAFASSDVPLLDNPDVLPFKGGVAEAKERFSLAIKDVDNLLSNYDTISKSGGDNVRLYLGTIGVKSHMYGISKVLKVLKDEADDIVEFTEAVNEFEAYLFQAEGAAYQSMFVEHSSARSTPESLMKTARGDVVNMRKFMGDVAAQLGL